MAEIDYQHPKCYASPLNNCCKKITQEHYLSEGVFKVHIEWINKINPVVGIGKTFTDQDGNKANKVDKRIFDPVRANILCGDHNSALSYIDESGIAMAKALNETHERPYTNSKIYHIDGELFEKYILKCTCGHIAATKDNSSTQVKRFPVKWLDYLFSKEALPEGTGLYFHPKFIGNMFRNQEVTALHHSSDETIASGGTRIMSGWQFSLLLQVGTGEIEATPKPVYRPTKLIFKDSGFEREIVFTWPCNVKENIFIIEAR